MLFRSKKKSAALTPGERALGKKEKTGDDAVGANARELQVLRMLAPAKHSGLANLLAVVESRRAVHAVLEYCAGGSLQRHLVEILCDHVLLQRGQLAAAAPLCETRLPSHAPHAGFLSRDLFARSFVQERAHDHHVPLEPTCSENRFLRPSTGVPQQQQNEWGSQGSRSHAHTKRSDFPVGAAAISPPNLRSGHNSPSKRLQHPHTYKDPRFKHLT